MAKTWEEIKQTGSGHYKSRGEIEPIDLYKSLGVMIPFALTSIIKYASRNLSEGRLFSIEDMDKIIHYAEIVKSMVEENNDSK